ncbi:hypothetical protein L6164_005397 [Bauhinia variegata]|uniref:Uncharacterized protein n=1 Tax=Bauhinia variegata TaxID=167791 RepID=A0ACB9PR63_BAUVA|nr:hypothetical protein L6164_005397 [Bauhinia variegata]
MRKPCCKEEESNKGCWSKQEDQKLMDYIKAHGEGRWRSIPHAAGLRRCGKSCRLRWLNYLKPGVKHGDFGEDEEDLIIRLHALLGNRWALIAGRLPGRTDNEVKNYWNCHIRKKLIHMGHDLNNLHGFRSSVLAPFKSIGPKINEVPECNINSFPDLNLDLTLGTSSEEKEALQD